MGSVKEEDRDRKGPFVAQQHPSTYEDWSGLWLAAPTSKKESAERNYCEKVGDGEQISASKVQRMRGRPMPHG